MNSAAPTPCRMRANTSVPSPGAAPQRADAMVKTARPATNMRRAPSRSPRPPASSSTLANAARKLGVDNTTVGRRLSALERDLGAKLFARTPDGLALTVAGEAMRAAGAEMEQAVLRGEQRALGADRKPSGVVRIATTE